MRIKFDLTRIWFGESGSHWWTETSRLKMVLEVLESSSFLKLYRYVAEDTDNPKWIEFHSHQELWSVARAWKAGTYLLSPEPTSKSDMMVFLRLGPGFLQIYSIYYGVFESREITHHLNACIQVVSRLHSRFNHEILFGPEINISAPFELSVPSFRPPRQFCVLKRFSMVDYFCKTYFDEQASDERRQEVEKLLSLKTPDWVERREQGDLVILRWVDRFDDEEHIRERMTRRLVWLIKHLDPPISSNFNEKGDQRANPSVRDDSEGLTIYDPISRHGYKATVCSEDGSVDEALFEQMTQWLQTQETPAGEELCALHLILPSREAALRIRKRAEESGIGRVLYMGQDGNLWDPFPPGDWLEDDYLA